jgi:acyl-CoA thioesterase I
VYYWVMCGMRFMGVVCVGLALLVGGCSATPSLSRLPADAVVLAFGDSLTAGTGAEENQAYPAVLSGLIGRKVVNAGVPGEETDAGLQRLPETLEAHRPQLLILCHGGNDLLRKRDPVRTAENLRAMIRLARAQNVAVVLLGVPAPGIIPSAPKFYGDLAGEFRIPYDGEIIADIETDRSLKADPIHPNAAGYRVLAERIVILLKKAGAV